jgi:hypothetical protein
MVCQKWSFRKGIFECSIVYANFARAANMATLICQLVTPSERELIHARHALYVYGRILRSRIWGNVSAFTRVSSAIISRKR